jgi:hypothetical protein
MVKEEVENIVPRTFLGSKKKVRHQSEGDRRGEPTMPSMLPAGFAIAPPSCPGSSTVQIYPAELERTWPSSATGRRVWWTAKRRRSRSWGRAARLSGGRDRG